MSLEAIAIPPIKEEPPQRLFVNLHGWGANGADLAPLATIYDIPACYYFFPTAPFNHPEVLGGKAWYALETKAYEGLGESRQQLQDWLRSLADLTGVPLSRTVLGGFSQGGAMALDVGLGLPLAGIISLSGYLHFQPETSDTERPPILLLHGTQDQVVPLAAAQFAQQNLAAIGAKVDFHEFEGGHEIPLEIIPLIRNFVLEQTWSD